MYKTYMQLTARGISNHSGRVIVLFWQGICLSINFNTTDKNLSAFSE